MRKEQMRFYENEFEITDYALYKSLKKSEDLHIFYKYDSKNEVEAGKSMDRALGGPSADEIGKAMRKLRELGCDAPPTADVLAIEPLNSRKVGTLVINENTYYFLNEWEDLSENYDN